MKNIVIIGAGGCAREVAWTVRQSHDDGERYHVRGYVVSDASKVGPYDSRDEILGDFDWLERNAATVDGVLMGIGSPQIRARVLAELQSRSIGLRWPTIIHPAVPIDRDSCNVGQGVVVCASAVVTVNVTLGEHVLVHYGATISHEASIGACSVVNPGANVSGGVRMGRRVMVGAGAQILQYRVVGDDAVIGAGAVVTRDVEPGEKVIGIPAAPASESA